MFLAYILIDVNMPSNRIELGLECLAREASLFTLLDGGEDCAREMGLIGTIPGEDGVLRSLVSCVRGTIRVEPSIGEDVARLITKELEDLPRDEREIGETIQHLQEDIFDMAFTDNCEAGYSPQSEDGY